MGRYGAEACNLVEAAQPGELQPIAPSPSLWAESRWAARNEGVVHLDDLLARRVRLNINLPGGGMEKNGKKSKKSSNRNWAGTTSAGGKRPNGTGNCGRIPTPQYKKTDSSRLSHKSRNSLPRSTKSQSSLIKAPKNFVIC